MTARAAGWLLWVTFACVIPLPFFLVESGAVPAARLLLLGGAASAIVVGEGPAGAVAIVAGLLLGQALLYLAALWWLAAALARGLARSGRRGTAVLTALVVLASVGAAASFDLYRTPFRSRSLHGNLLEIFE